MSEPRGRRVESVLARDGSYDALSAAEQAVVRRVWDERVAERRAGLDLEVEFRAAGRGWVQRTKRAAWSDAVSRGVNTRSRQALH
jgi:hypothetical protein